jgi:hypothetical protein
MARATLCARSTSFVKIEAARPKMVAFARVIASSSVAKVSKPSTGPNISIQRRHGRLAFHDADQAASELERCVTKLGFKGVMVNGCSQIASCQNPEADFGRHRNTPKATRSGQQTWPLHFF